MRGFACPLVHDHGPFGLQPHIVPVLGEESVVPRDRFTLLTNCGERERREGGREGMKEGGRK